MGLMPHRFPSKTPVVPAVSWSDGDTSHLCIFDCCFSVPTTTVNIDSLFLGLILVFSPGGDSLQTSQ
jgi:hypothetical protein